MGYKEDSIYIYAYFRDVLCEDPWFIERKNIFDIFLKGAKEGLEIVINIFPTLIGLFVAISALRYSGILDFIIKLISPIINMLHIPVEIMPLAILRPISRKCICSNRNRYNE